MCVTFFGRMRSDIIYVVTTTNDSRDLSSLKPFRLNVLCWLNSSHASANKAITEDSYYPLNYSTLACAGVEEGKVKMRNAISSKPSTAKFRPSSQGAFGKRHEEWL